MITRLEITYKSKEPCNVKPHIFTSGGYAVKMPDDRRISFDFEDMEAVCEFEDGYLYIHCLQKNIDECYIDDDITLEILNDYEFRRYHEKARVKACLMAGLTTAQSCWYKVELSKRRLRCLRTKAMKERPMWLRPARPELA